MGRSLLSIAASGYILFFFSEHLFWTQANPDTLWLEYAITWFAYTLLTFILLALIHRFRARTVWALFLCGAAYGWLKAFWPRRSTRACPCRSRGPGSRGTRC